LRDAHRWQTVGVRHYHLHCPLDTFHRELNDPFENRYFALAITDLDVEQVAEDLCHSEAAWRAAVGIAAYTLGPGPWSSHSLPVFYLLFRYAAAVILGDAICPECGNETPSLINHCEYCKS
jgi:hypothetical protein